MWLEKKFEYFFHWQRTSLSPNAGHCDVRSRSCAGHCKALLYPSAGQCNVL